ncbi:MAG TPA: hypothetical protein PLP57_08475 [Candidatus Saccharicenans sp.]|jgi:hypothetical protein|nr:hypothetical protein [Candidatus Saccharicenans sp.]HRD02659.1 hypothetical protein [Candidatus Saccharicenans sp.]
MRRLDGEQVIVIGEIRKIKRRRKKVLRWLVNIKYFFYYLGKDISHGHGKDISHPDGKQISNSQLE